MGHLQSGAGRLLFRCGEKVNYTPQAVGPVEWGRETHGDGGVEDREGGREGLTRLGGAAGRGRIKTSVWDEEET